MDLVEGGAEVTLPERRWAAAVHVSSVFWPLIGPLVGWVLGRERAFVAAHARRALFETLWLQGLLCLGGLVSLIYTATRLMDYAKSGWESVNWWEFVLRFAVGFVIVVLLQALNTVLSVRQAWRAWHGHWPGKNPVSA
ncbi:MAG: DUF4870 domain-containing protein [Fimbriimonadaceae bacterium]|nr:DUF4870 domain-containing protein [Fimbriimonadaceae bacterium]QYK58783.1 MAG: DUF4870 domain-containing protein [Fimbriimonadaceae bacterium]